MAQFKSSLNSPKVSVKLQGGMGSSDAVTQKTSIQKKAGTTNPGASDIKYTVQPSGTHGAGTTAGKPRD
jgi:hypothetical protein